MKRNDKTTVSKIRSMRAKGFTYSEIQKSIGKNVPKSTLSYICRGVVLSAVHQQRFARVAAEAGERGRIKAHAVNRQKRQEYLKKIDARAEASIVGVNRKALKVALAMLYLGEGAKWHGHSGLVLGSSDPMIIQIFMQLLQQCYKVDRTTLCCRISYRADQNIDALTKYWSDVTGIEKGRFYKTIPDPRTVGKPTRKQDYKGVCVIFGGNTEIQLELESIAKTLNYYLGP